jgi:hypothetical protein
MLLHAHLIPYLFLAASLSIAFPDSFVAHAATLPPDPNNMMSWSVNDFLATAVSCTDPQTKAIDVLNKGLDLHGYPIRFEIDDQNKIWYMPPMDIEQIRPFFEPFRQPLLGMQPFQGPAEPFDTLPSDSDTTSSSDIASHCSPSSPVRAVLLSFVAREGRIAAHCSPSSPVRAVTREGPVRDLLGTCEGPVRAVPDLTLLAEMDTAELAALLSNVIESVDPFAPLAIWHCSFMGTPLGPFGAALSLGAPLAGLLLRSMSSMMSKENLINKMDLSKENLISKMDLCKSNIAKLRSLDLQLNSDNLSMYADAMKSVLQHKFEYYVVHSLHIYIMSGQDLKKLDSPMNKLWAFSIVDGVPHFVLLDRKKGFYNAINTALKGGALGVFISKNKFITEKTFTHGFDWCDQLASRMGAHCSPSSPVRAVLLSFVAREGRIAAHCSPSSPVRAVTREGPVRDLLGTCEGFLPLRWLLPWVWSRQFVGVVSRQWKDVLDLPVFELTELPSWSMRDLTSSIHLLQLFRLDNLSYTPTTMITLHCSPSSPVRAVTREGPFGASSCPCYATREGFGDAPRSLRSPNDKQIRIIDGSKSMLVNGVVYIEQPVNWHCQPANHWASMMDIVNNPNWPQNYKFVSYLIAGVKFNGPASESDWNKIVEMLDLSVEKVSEAEAEGPQSPHRSLTGPSQVPHRSLTGPSRVAQQCAAIRPSRATKESNTALTGDEGEQCAAMHSKGVTSQMRTRLVIGAIWLFILSVVPEWKIKHQIRWDMLQMEFLVMMLDCNLYPPLNLPRGDWLTDERIEFEHKLVKLNPLTLVRSFVDKVSTEDEKMVVATIVSSYQMAAVSVLSRLSASKRGKQLLKAFKELTDTKVVEYETRDGIRYMKFVGASLETHRRLNYMFCTPNTYWCNKINEYRGYNKTDHMQTMLFTVDQPGNTMVDPTSVADAANRLLMTSLRFGLEPWFVTAMKYVMSVGDHGQVSMARMALEIGPRVSFYPMISADFRGRLYISLHCGYTSFKISRPYVTIQGVHDRLTQNGLKWLLTYAGGLILGSKASFNERLISATMLCQSENAILTPEAFIQSMDPSGPFGAEENLQKRMEKVFGYLLVGALSTMFGMPWSVLVWFDCTSSGFQVISVVTKDRVMGKLCNMVSEGSEAADYKTRNDVYSYVLEQTQGSKMQKLLGEKYNRSLVKGVTMKLGYNQGAKGLLKSLAEDNVITRDHQYSQEMITAAKELQNKIRRMFKGLDQFMRWCAMIASLHGYFENPIEWTLPDGVRISMKYVMKSTSTIKLVGQKPLSYKTFTKIYDRSKTIASFSPNLVHSMDAYICRFILKQMTGRLLVIHDAFGCHPNDVDKLHSTFEQAMNGLMNGGTLLDIHTRTIALCNLHGVENVVKNNKTYLQHKNFKGKPNGIRLEQLPVLDYTWKRVEINIHAVS